MSTKQTPLVSIIVPTYNCMPYLKSCISSIVGQSYENLEIIVIDDGSDDGTSEYLSSISDIRLHVSTTENNGVSEARNLALDHTTGDYVLFVDADDAIEGCSIERGVELAEKYQLDMVVGGLTKTYSTRKEGYGIHYESTSSFRIYEGRDVEKVIEKTVSYEAPGDPFLASFFMSGSVCKLIKRNTIGSTRFDTRLVIGEDTLFNIKVLKRCDRVGFTPDNWYTYNIRTTSAVRSYRAGAFENAELLLKRINEEFPGWNAIGKWHPCVVERGVHQFYGACCRSIFHRNSESSFWQKYTQLQSLLKSPFWSSLFSNKDGWLHTISKGQLRLIGRCCSNNWAVLLCLYFWIRSREAIISGEQE